MPLKPGTLLGPHEIISLIGQGGMGEVYKARDTRLNRIVAIKTLPAHLAERPELRERFKREASTLANLKHAHICTLYDIGHQELSAEDFDGGGVAPRLAGPPEAAGSRRTVGIDFLVMEYLEGATLAERLKKGALPLEQVWRYAIELADALDKAHRANFTHRDIKPGNIMLTKEGSKLLDFGLAKLKQEVAKAITPASEVPTAPGVLTQHGTLLGTLQYMAPEQVEGKTDELDGRTDVFAFGAVVYEMATGKKAFDGKNQSSVIAKILEIDPPPMSTLQPPGKMSPPALDRVVKRCLAKDREERWQTAFDLWQDLQWIKESGAQAALPVPVGLRGRLRAHLGWIVAAAILLAFLGTLAALVSRVRSTPAAGPTIRFSVPAPENTAFTGSAAAPWPAVSPDGLRVAFVTTSTSGSADAIWIRSFDSLTARMLPGTEGALLPFWSPDGRTIGFFAGGKLKKIDVSGGPPLVLCDAPIGANQGGGTWNRDGVIVFSRSGGLFRVSAAGGEANPVTKLEGSRGEIAHSLPNFLPDGRHFLYWVRSSKPETGGTYLGSLDSNQSVRLLNAGYKSEYSSGHVLFMRGLTLLAQPFDLHRLELTGEPFPVAEKIGYNTANGRAAFSASANGTLVFGPGGGAGANQLLWFDRGGKPLGPMGPPSVDLDPELSPDGKRVAGGRTDSQTGTADLWLLETARSVATRFTFDPANDWYPIWSPDGSRIAFRSSRAGQYDLYQKLSSGAEKEELLLKSSANKYALDWSSDGRFLIYGDDSGKGGLDLWVLPLFGERKPFPFLQTEFNEDHAQLSPDGRWLAYISNESGRYDVYIQSFPKPGGKWQVSTAGGIAPRWRRDGKELFYIAPDAKLMAVAVKGDPALETGAPVALFETRIVESGAYVETDKQQYDVTPDGQRFLLNTPAEGAASAPLTVVLNWFEELKRRVPASK